MMMMIMIAYVSCIMRFGFMPFDIDSIEFDSNPNGFLKILAINELIFNNSVIIKLLLLLISFIVSVLYIHYRVAKRASC